MPVEPAHEDKPIAASGRDQIQPAANPTWGDLMPARLRPPTAAEAAALRLAGLLLLAGAAITFVHDYAYRRGGGDDLELGGLISHAGSDMLILTVILAAVALLWQLRR